jgi:drug/metabolite transporter (DMT)-like permease
VSRRERIDPLAAGLLMACCVAWGANQVAIKVSLRGLSPVLGAGLRSLVAGGLLLLWCWARGQRPVQRDGTARYGALIGVMFAAEFALLYAGLRFTTASRSVIFIYAAPFFVAIGAHYLVPGERLTRLRGLGLALAFAGLCLAFADGLRLPTPRQLVGDALELLAGLLWAATTVVVKMRGEPRPSPERTLLYQLGVSGVLLTAVGAVAGDRPIDGVTPLVVAAFAYQAVVVAFASYLVWFWLLARYPASGVASFAFWTPLFGVLAGALLLGERLTGGLGIAAALVAAGIVLVTRR